MKTAEVRIIKCIDESIMYWIKFKSDCQSMWLEYHDSNLENVRWFARMFVKALRNCGAKVILRKKIYDNY